jgi:hypothetical protein
MNRNPRCRSQCSTSSNIQTQDFGVLEAVEAVLSAGECGCAFLAILDGPNRLFARSGDSMHGRANGTATGLRPRLFDLRRRIAAPASRRESNPRFFKAENALADVLAHDEFSLRDALYVNDLR